MIDWVSCMVIALVYAFGFWLGRYSRDSGLCLTAVLVLSVGLPVLAGPNEALAAACADARTLPPPLAYKTRYLDMSVYTPEQRMEFIPAFRGHVAEMSRTPYFLPPRPVADGLLLAVVLDYYGWDTKVWEQFTVDPYHHGWVKRADGYSHYQVPSYIDKALKAELYRLTQSYAPVVSADWWFFYTSRQLDLDNKEIKYGYFDQLGLKKRADFEALGGTDKKAAIKLGLEMLAAVKQGRSGVAQLDRGIEWYRVLTGSLYLTLDADSLAGGNLIAAKLARGTFKHKAEEGYVSLPNGMWAFWLGDEKGVRANTAPDFIGPNDSTHRKGRDGRIHICQSCKECHDNGGLKDVDDWARRNFKMPGGLESADYQKFLELYGQYFSDLKAQIEKDRQAYREALKKHTGLTPEAYAKYSAQIYYGYLVDEWTPERLARRAGVQPDKLVNSLRRYAAAKGGGLDDYLAPLKELTNVPPEGIPVRWAEEMYPGMMKILGDYP